MKSKPAALAIILLLVGSYGYADTAGHDRNRPQEAKHIILFIGDGMHLEHEIASSRYLYGKDYGLVWHKFPYQTSVSTWDVTTYNTYAKQLGKSPYDFQQIVPATGYDPDKGGKRPYPLQKKGFSDEYFLTKLKLNPEDPGEKAKEPATDSASAATAWATGFKTDDGHIAWLAGNPPGGALKTIAEILREEKGFAIGIVTTVPFSHATPAAHVSHNKSRHDYDLISEEMMTKTKPEVVIGGGHPNWSAGYISAALLGAVKGDPSYTVVERIAGIDGGKAVVNGAEAAVKQGKKLFGLFGGHGGNLEPPVPLDSPGSPRVARSTIENPLLKDAVLAALRVLSKDAGRFFVIFEQGDIDGANHDNSFSGMVGAAWDLNEAVKAAVDFVNQPGDEIHWLNTLLIVTSDHANSCMRLNDNSKLGKGDLPRQETTTMCPDAYCGKYVYPDREVTYGTDSHTNELVRLYAFGKGARLIKPYQGEWYPCTRIIDNTHLFNVIAEAAGLAHRSPLKTQINELTTCPEPARSLSSPRGRERRPPSISESRH